MNQYQLKNEIDRILGMTSINHFESPTRTTLKYFSPTGMYLFDILITFSSFDQAWFVGGYGMTLTANKLNEMIQI